MRADKETYSKVAKHCSKFNCATKCGCTNSTLNHDEISCTKCTHFDKKHFCRLNLFDEIRDNHNL